jgi:hypothetical protein
VVATIMLASALILAVAEEMPWLPDCWIRHASKELARKRTLRNLYICFVVGIVFITTVVNMVKKSICLIFAKNKSFINIELLNRYYLRITSHTWNLLTASIILKIARTVLSKEI